jgi:cytoskeletal protein CcmA (bactofilin family)
MFSRKPDPGLCRHLIPETEVGRATRGCAAGQSGLNRRKPPTESVIGSDLSIEGQTITIRCQGSLRVNGHIQADLHSMQLTVGEQGRVSGSIAAETVEVYGNVQGAIRASRVVLHATARVEGEIHSQYLSIEQGAYFEGKSRKLSDAQEIAPRAAPHASNGGQVPLPPPIPQR